MVCRTVYYCRDVTRKSRGSAAVAGGWEVVGPDSDDGRTGTVYFFSTRRPGLFLALTLQLDGSETVERFEVWRQHQTGPAQFDIGTRLLRSVPLGRLARAALLELRRRADHGTDPRFWQGDPAGQEQAMLQSLALRSEPIGGHTRPGRRGHPDDYYAQLAVDYQDWLRTGERLAGLAERHHMSESALRAALHTARRKDFLTPALRGRAGGTATDKARAVLASRTSP
jgi:hypothetical protein